MVNKIKVKENKKIIKKTDDSGTEILDDSIAQISGVVDNNVPEKQIFDPEGELVVDVFETKSDFVVLAALAGVKITDLDISVEKDMMVIKGNRQDPHDQSDKNYFYQECYWGPFSRKIVLPENIDVEKTSAQMEKGILTVSIPKKSVESS